MIAIPFARPAILFVVALAALTVTPTDSMASDTIPLPEEKIVYKCSPGAGFDVCIVNPDGSEWQNLTNDTTGENTPRLSPDGRFIVMQRDTIDIYLMNSDGTNLHRILPDIIAHFGSPSWSPDGQQIAFICDDPEATNVHGICTVNRDGSNFQMIKVTDDRGTYLEWNPAGGTMLVGFDTQSINDDMFILNIASGALTNITNTPDDYEFGTWSPDGTKIAFVGTPLQSEPRSLVGLYTINPDGTGRTHLFTSEWSANATNPSWSPDGARIVYFCSESDVGADELCFVDADSGNLIDAQLEDFVGKYAIASEPDWGLTGGTPGGDIDCGGTADAIDALKLLRHDAGLSVSQGPVCVALGDEVTLNGVTFAWGDIDCDAAIGAIDALKVLRHDASLSVSQTEPCPDLGAVLT